MKKINFKKILPIFLLNFIFLSFLSSCGEKEEMKIAKEVIGSCKTEIPIGISVDEDNIYLALVTLQSLINNSKESTIYRVFILYSELKNKTKEKFSHLEDQKNNLKCEFINMKETSKNIFSDVSENILYYKLNVPNVFLKTTKKCITIDAGVLINSDLQELFNSDLFEFCIAGVLDSRVRNLSEDYKEKFGIENLDQYINSSVLLWNLEKCRSENLVENFSSFLRSHNNEELLYEEQCILNSVCLNQIINLPLKFNYVPRKSNDDEEEEEFFMKFSEIDLNEAKKAPEIINFLQDSPWNNTNVIMGEKWWEGAKKTKFWDEILNKYLFKNIKCS